MFLRMETSSELNKRIFHGPFLGRCTGESLLSRCEWTISGWDNVQSFIDQALSFLSQETRNSLLLSMVNAKLKFPALRFVGVLCWAPDLAMSTCCYAMEYPGQLASVVGPTHCSNTTKTQTRKTRKSRRSSREKPWKARRPRPS